MKYEFMDDVFGITRLAAVQVAHYMLDEAWTPERKDEIVRSMAERGGALVDHMSFGDYDLTLWCFERHNNLYAVSINSGQEDPTTADGQQVKPKPGHLDFDDVIHQLRLWVRQHGKILVSSVHIRRIRQYRRMLRRYFLIGEWDMHPNAGFFVMPD